MIVEDDGHGCVVVAVVAKLLRGDEISKLLSDRGKESEPRSQGRRDERRRGGRGEMYRKEGNGFGEGRGFDNCNSVPCQRVSSAAVVWWLMSRRNRVEKGGVCTVRYLS